MSIQRITDSKYKIDVPIRYIGNKRIRHIETFYGTKTDAKLRESKIKLEIKNNTYMQKNKMTLEMLINEWLDYKKPIVAKKTYVTNVLYSKNIIKNIGYIKLDKLNVKILEDFYNKLRTTTNFADKTIRHHYNILSAALNCAVKWEYIPTNPNKKVQAIKVRKKEVEAYSFEEVQVLLNCIQDEDIKTQAIILLALDSSCRRGEITGLKWSDVNFNNNSIDVNKTTQYVPGYGVFEKTTKSSSGDRIIYLAQTTMNVLKQYKMEQEKIANMLGEKWKNSERVFTTNDGNDMKPDTPYLIFQKVIKKYGLRKIPFHALRHTSISLQIANNIQPQIISKRAGHSDISVTHSTYSHFFNNSFKEVANTMDKILHT